MKPYLSDADFTLYCGDAREVLAELPAESVHMALTSPPFFGLRDYGTGQWEGGDAGCDHMRDSRFQDQEQKLYNEHGTIPGVNRARASSYGQVCSKCGARRVDRQIGLEATPEEWVASLVAVFEEVRRVLRKDGTLWVECGDSYASGWATARRSVVGAGSPPLSERANRLSGSLKEKDLIGQPFLLAFALREAGWYWRGCYPWAKSNPMPESVTDRFTTSHSYVLHFAKSKSYFHDAEAVREGDGGNDGTRPFNPATEGVILGRKNNPHGGLSNTWLAGAGRNRRSVISLPTQPYAEAHFATWPEKLCELFIKAGTSERGCCPECGAPWVREVETATEHVQATNTNNDSDPHGRGRTRHQFAGQYQATTTTTGWRPSCECFGPFEFERNWAGLPPIPATCLDPFLGSGTSALVARRLGRKCIGVELSQDYCELAAKRTQQLSLEAV